MISSLPLKKGTHSGPIQPTHYRLPGNIMSSEWVAKGRWALRDKYIATLKLLNPAGPGTLSAMPENKLRNFNGRSSLRAARYERICGRKE